MKNFLIALVLAIVLFIAGTFAYAAYKVYVVYPAQGLDRDGCPINGTPLEP